MDEMGDAGEAIIAAEEIREIFLDVFRQLTRRETEPEFSISFYPFAGLNHTIRIRNRAIFVRLSDTMTDAPHGVYRALAQILIGRLLKRRPPREAEDIYRRWAYRPEVLERADAARRARGRKQLSSPEGRFHNLSALWDSLNREYFDNQLEKPTLSWSARPTRRILGHHDSVHETIVISRSLDARPVPRFVVAYVLYHEMLHIKHATTIRGGRRSFHPPAFRRDEQQFRDYDLAMNWLEHSLRRR